MSEKVRWGIVGTGSIAKAFASGLKAVPDAQLVTVGSRAQHTADAFGDRYGVPRRYDSYEALAHDPDVDVVYVATPHALHKDNTLMSLEAGKAVLCEKPFSINVREAEAMIRCARDRRLFLMEAMWTRYLPVMEQVRQWIADGGIGEVRMVQADFGFRAGFNPESRMFNPHLGGGSLLDVGVYTISLAFMVFGGPPARITGLADIGRTGVDEQAAFLLGYDGGRLAVLSSAVRTSTPQEATIMGTEGRIRIEAPFWNARAATLTVAGKEPARIAPRRTGNGYNYEAAEVGACLRAGKLESDRMPLDETLAILRVMDTLRAQWGVRYPME